MVEEEETRRLLEEEKEEEEVEGAVGRGWLPFLWLLLLLLPPASWGGVARL